MTWKPDICLKCLKYDWNAGLIATLSNHGCALSKKAEGTDLFALHLESKLAKCYDWG